MFTLCVIVLSAAPAAAPPVADAEGRAIAYLARRVPVWKTENRCYSCHHNGDATRALYAAVRLGRAVPRQAVEDTTRWLGKPGGWDKNGGDGPFNDKRLARVQFAAALADALEAGLSRDERALEQAARLVIEQQDRDGSWQVVSAETVGGPTTYGTALATHLARRALLRAGAKRHSEAIARADRWLREAPVDRVLDAAAVLLGLGTADDAVAAEQRRRGLERIRKGESRGGGWGPYVNSAPEAFDTAVVLLALTGQPRTPEVQGWLKRGRAYLLATQEKEGNWPETTRPAGAESYPQRLSTTGWATLALLASGDRRR